MSFGQYRNQCSICGAMFPCGSANALYCPICKRNRGKKASAIRRSEGYFSNNELDRYLILERDSFTCCYCGKTPLTDMVKLHLDHIIPRSKGGTDTAGNLITSCQRCNLAKGSRPLQDDFLKRLLVEVDIRNNFKKIPKNKIIKVFSEYNYTQKTLLDLDL